MDQICRALYSKNPASEGLPRPQYLYLRLLEASGPITQIRLAQLGGIDTSTLSAVLGRLVAKNFVKRTRNPVNGREKLVAIAPGGIAALKRAEPAYVLSHATLLETKGIDSVQLIALIGTVARAPFGAAPDWQPESVTAADPEKLGALFRSLSFLIRRAHQRFDAAILAGAAPFELTLRQYAAIIVLHYQGQMTEAGICRMLGYDASNAALVIGVLVEKGLATPVDQRLRSRKRYALTRAGRALLLNKEPTIQTVERDGLQPLNDAEIDTLRNMLASIVIANGHHMRRPLHFFEDVRLSPHWAAPLFTP